MAVSKPGILLIAIYSHYDIIRGMIDMATDFVGVTTAAQIVGVTPSRIRVLVRGNRIKAEEIDGRYLIQREEIDRFKRIPRLPGKPRKKS